MLARQPDLSPRARWQRVALCLVTVVLGAIVALPAPVAAQGQPPTNIRLRLDWVWQAPQSIFTIAERRGFYRDEGLNVTIDRGFGGPDNAAALAAGNYEFMFGDPGSAILFNARNPAGVKLTSVFNIYDAYLGAIITRSGNGIKSPRDLEGRTIGAPLTTGGRTMFPAFARANGIDESKVTWQTIGIQLQDQQFAKGEWDAIAGFSTTSLLNLKRLGMSLDKLTVFHFADHGVDLYGSGIITRSDFMQSNPEAVRRFVRATVRGIHAMLANKTEAIETLRLRDPLLDPAIELERLNMMIDITLKRPAVERNGVGTVDAARMQRNIDTISRVFNLSPVPKLEEAYTERFIPPQSERMLKF